MLEISLEKLRFDLLVEFFTAIGSVLLTLFTVFVDIFLAIFGLGPYAIQNDKLFGALILLCIFVPMMLGIYWKIFQMGGK